MTGVLQACEPSSSTDRESSHGQIEEELQPIAAQEFSSPPVVGLPAQIELSHSKLWIVDAAGDPYLHVLDAASGDLLWSMGRTGDGPWEFSSLPANVQPSSDDDGSFWVFDVGHQRMLRIDSAPRRTNEPELITLRAPSPVMHTLWVGDRLLGVTNSQEERFIFFDREGVITQSVPHPFLGSQDVPTVERQKASTTAFRICPAPEGDGFLLLYFTASVIERFDRDGNFLGLIDVPHPSGPSFSESEDGVSRHTLRRWHYIDCAATPNGLFALYSDRTFDRQAIESPGGRSVHVFDWTGQLRTTYRLEHPASTIAVTPAGDRLYTASLQSPGILLYSLAADPKEPVAAAAPTKN